MIQQSKPVSLMTPTDCRWSNGPNDPTRALTTELLTMGDAVSNSVLRFGRSRFLLHT